MILPEVVRAEVAARLGPIRSARPVGGGCVSPAARIDLEGGSAFLKYDPGAPAGMFAVEAAGLERLRAVSSGIRVPRVLAVGEPVEAGAPGWIALEWFGPARRAGGFGARLGRGLAAIHRAKGSAWGWERDGFIGPLSQSNAPAAGWARFWWERRLEPQLRRARERGSRPGASGDWDRLADRLPELLAAGEEDGPSLLHGDLWGGNVLAVGEGEPALIDPATYHGHREVDLAMSELFGGFDRDFYAAYEEEWPLSPGYAEVRRDLYQLYYLLVHVNLFGEGYVAQTNAALRRVLTRA